MIRDHTAARYAGAEVFSLSCAPAGYCTAGGFYLGRSGQGQGFVVSQRHIP